MPNRICVIGGINIDVHLRALAGPMAPRTSNPSSAIVSAGGVARNVAENLARWGGSVSLFGATGDDALSAAVLRATAASGVDVSRVRIVPGATCGVYAALLDRNGELAMGASAMDISESIDERYLEELAPSLRDARIIVLDANLTTQAIEAVLAIAHTAGVPVIGDPVSREKAPRLATASGEALAVTPNVHESYAFADERRRLSAEWTVVTRGALGIELVRADGVRRSIVPEPVEVRDVSGAGDALVAGIAFGLCEGLDFERAAELGVRTAREAVAHEGSVVVGLGPIELDRLIAQIERGEW